MNPLLYILILIISTAPGALQADNAYQQALSCEKSKNYRQAAQLFNMAADENSNDHQKRFSIATKLIGIGYIDDALTIYQDLSHHLQSLSLMYNTAFALKCQGNLTKAISLYNEILIQNPNHEQAHLGLAFSYMMLGDYHKGWQEHTWNLRNQLKDSEKLRYFLANDQIAGKTIYLKSEGGLGDSLQFVRYAQRLKKLGAHIIVSIPKSLYPKLGYKFDTFENKVRTTVHT